MYKLVVWLQAAGRRLRPQGEAALVDGGDAGDVGDVGDVAFEGGASARRPLYVSPQAESSEIELLEGLFCRELNSKSSCGEKQELSGNPVQRAEMCLIKPHLSRNTRVILRRDATFFFCTVVGLK